MIRRSLRPYGTRLRLGGLRAFLFYAREKNRERRKAAIIRAGSFVASDTGTLLTLQAPSGFSFPVASQNVELLTLNFNDATLQVAGTSGEITEVDDISTIFGGLAEGDIERGITSVDLVRDSDSAVIPTTFRILVIGAA